MNREEYLERAVEKLRPLFLRQKLIIPPIIKVSCGFPSKNPLKNLGECHLESTFDGSVQIFVSPIHPDALTTLGTICHELLHSTLSPQAKHGPEFRNAMKLIGLEGKARSAGPGPELELVLVRMAEELGDYPNPTIHPKEKKKRDVALAKKSFKLFCSKFRNAEKSCRLVEVAKAGDYVVTVSRKNLKLGFPLCPGCSTEMEMEPEDFELYKMGEEVTMPILV